MPCDLNDDFANTNGLYVAHKCPLWFVYDPFAVDMR